MVLANPSMSQTHRLALDFKACQILVIKGNTGLVSSRVSLTSWGECASLALVGHPSSDCITIKIPYGADIYYVDQPRTPSFPIGLVKAKSDFIVRSLETGLGR